MHKRWWFKAIFMKEGIPSKPQKSIHDSQKNRKQKQICLTLMHLSYNTTKINFRNCSFLSFIANAPYEILFKQSNGLKYTSPYIRGFRSRCIRIIFGFNQLLESELWNIKNFQACLVRKAMLKECKSRKQYLLLAFPELSTSHQLFQ